MSAAPQVNEGNVTTTDVFPRRVPRLLQQQTTHHLGFGLLTITNQKGIMKYNRQHTYSSPNTFVSYISVKIHRRTIAPNVIPDKGVAPWTFAPPPLILCQGSGGASKRTSSAYNLHVALHPSNHHGRTETWVTLLNYTVWKHLRMFQLYLSSISTSQKHRRLATKGTRMIKT